MSIWEELKLVHLASNASFHRGISYHQNKAVLNGTCCGEGIYKGEVKGSNENVYHVSIDINHPRKSKCNCPFANGRRVVCKHMVALYFYYFPKQADAIIAEIEEEKKQKKMHTMNGKRNIKKSDKKSLKKLQLM